MITRTAPKSSQAIVSSNDSMAGNRQWTKRVLSQCLTHSSRCWFQSVAEHLVRCNLTFWNLQYKIIHLVLKRGYSLSSLEIDILASFQLRFGVFLYSYKMQDEKTRNRLWMQIILLLTSSSLATNVWTMDFILLADFFWIVFLVFAWVVFSNLALRERNWAMSARLMYRDESDWNGFGWSCCAKRHSVSSPDQLTT